MISKYYKRKWSDSTSFKKDLYSELRAEKNFNIEFNYDSLTKKQKRVFNSVVAYYNNPPLRSASGKLISDEVKKILDKEYKIQSGVDTGFRGGLQEWIKKIGYGLTQKERGVRDPLVKATTGRLKVDNHNFAVDVMLHGVNGEVSSLEPRIIPTKDYKAFQDLIYRYVENELSKRDGDSTVIYAYQKLFYLSGNVGIELLYIVIFES